MIIVALECSCGTFSIAIGRDGAEIFNYTSETFNAQAERMLPTLSEALAKLYIGYNEIDAYAVTVGPGSFTGIRIGLAAIAGLSFVHNTKIITATTLEVLAHGNADTLVYLPAGRGDFYQQTFVNGLGGEITCGPLTGGADPNATKLPNAQALLELAYRKYTQGQFDASVSPLYIKDADATKSKQCA